MELLLLFWSALCCPSEMLPSDHAKVLIVEDDAPTREMYRQALTTYGYRVTAMSDGLGALRHIDGERPDVVVLDLILPHVGGHDVYKELRGNPETCEIPVVIVTGSDASDLELHDFRFFLRKPISPETLARVVEDALAWPRALTT